MKDSRTGGDPMVVAVAEEQVADLRARLAARRWPDEIDGSDWDYGTSLAYMRELIAYWQAEYDRREHERAMNSFAHFRVRMDGLGVHSSTSAVAVPTRCDSCSRTAGRVRSSKC